VPYRDGKWLPLQIPEKHQRVLLDNSKTWRFRVLYGGRNGAKDYSFADVSLERGVRMPTRYICVREQQNTISDSIHQLLSDRIRELGLGPFYHVTNNEIVGSNGTSFSFRGLKDMNAEQIKSFQGADICIVVEGQSL
jgi:phage terminase large subunit